MGELHSRRVKQFGLERGGMTVGVGDACGLGTDDSNAFNFEKDVDYTIIKKISKFIQYLCISLHVNIKYIFKI